LLKQIIEMKNWIDIKNEIPTHENMVELMDLAGNTGMGYAAYFPFTTYQKNGLKGRNNTVIVPCDPYFDGWVILCDNGLTTNIKEDIVFWREIK